MVFSLSALWWRRVRGLWKLPDGRNWLKGKLVRVLMGGTMLSKSLIQFSVDGWGCVPSLLFTWGQTMVEVMKIMVTSFKRSYAWTATLSAPNPAASHWPMPPPETPGHLQASLGKICEYYINRMLLQVLFGTWYFFLLNVVTISSLIWPNRLLSVSPIRKLP